MLDGRSNTMRRLLITGGSGYLGSALSAHACLANSWQVAATFHSQPIGRKDIQALYLDLRDPAQIAQIVSDYAPDAIINTAYHKDGPDMHAVTTVAAGLLAQAAMSSGARFIQVSTDALLD